MRKITVTYAIVTPESAEQGDFDDTGFTGEVWEIEPTEDEINDACGSMLCAVADLVANKLPGVEASNYPDWRRGTWYTDADGDIDYLTGAETRKSYHLDGFTDDEEREIYLRVAR